MKNKKDFTVYFLMRSRKDAQGKCPLYARIVVNGNPAEMSLQISLESDDWNKGEGEAHPKTKELVKLNEDLQDARTQLQSHYRVLRSQNGPVTITAEAVKNAFLGIVTPIEKSEPIKPEIKELEKTLRWLFKEHNRIMVNVLRRGSMKNYYTTERYIQKFLESKFACGDIFLKDLSYSFITHFEDYIRTKPLKENDPCTNNGTMKHLERLKKAVSWAEKNEWIPKNPFAAYSLKFKHTTVEFLEEAELHTIEETHFNDPMRQKVKDLFVFCCYTGLCYADVMALTPANIVTGVDGILWIKTTRMKTDISFDVPLLDKALEIIDIFKLRKNELPRDTVFPYITNQEVNRSLKIIGEVCRINKRLTFHIARHTFATTVTLANDVPFESIKKMMGHTKLSTTLIYAQVVNTKLSKDMALLQKKLQKGRNHLKAV